ncbi:hypothetical protein SAMN02910356_02554 [Selenomonas sp. GACV-9]|uniref:hypothetical protein n=1 Tax=Selenomonas sp. GACV-9 TaxID=3158782 RepID=UPI0008E7CE4F|nr:hypothetical protein SAMN02910356_02554 [Selenomonas ruminantium]
MKSMWEKHVKSYTQDLMEATSDYMKSYEVRPGIYSNVDPATLLDVNSADFDVNRN